MDDLNKKHGVRNVKSPLWEAVSSDDSSKGSRFPLPQHPFPDGHPNLRDEVRVPGVMTSRTEATVRNELGREYACIENIDDQVGLVINKLQSMGELENTHIIYTADHGIAVATGLRGSRIYEHSWRVPFIVSGPHSVGHPGKEIITYSIFCPLSVILPELIFQKQFRQKYQTQFYG